MAKPLARSQRTAPKDANGSSPRRAEILQIAKELFAEKGYGATSIRDIAEASGLLAGSLYSHFRSKAEILSLVIVPFYEQLILEQNRVLALPRPGVERLEVMVERVLELCAQHHTEVRILHYEWPYIHSSAELADVVQGGARTLDLWREAVRAGIDDGTLRADLDPEIAIRILTSAIHGVIDRHRYRAGGQLPDERGLAWLGAQMRVTLLDGMAEPSARGGPN